MQLNELAAQYRATGDALRARAATLRLELAAMPRSGRASWKRASRVWSRWRARRCARRAISRIIMTPTEAARPGLRSCGRCGILIGMKRLHIKNNHNHTFRRVLAVLLAAAMTFALAGCSPRELHIGQVEVNTGVNTAWITPARGVDRFGIPASDFSAGADGSVTYTGTAYRVLQGIDVSTFQQDIDWQAVADSGIAFAVIRAGYRGYGKGGIVEDDRFRQNVAGACAAGLRVGLYFFSQAVTPEEAAEEAQWLVDAARDYKIDMPLVFDWENIDQSTVAAGDTVRTAEMTGEDVTACAVAFCETVTAAGYDAAVYGNRWQGYYDYDFTQLKDYAFWVSAPGTADDFYYAHDFWQYSYDGTVPGISGSVDRDLWFVPITT